MHFDLNELLVFGAFFNSHNFHFWINRWMVCSEHFVPANCVAANFERIARIRWNSSALTVSHAESIHTSVPLYRVSFQNRRICVPLFPFIGATYVDVCELYVFAIQDNNRNGLNFSMQKRHFSVVPLLRYGRRVKTQSQSNDWQSGRKKTQFGKISKNDYVVKLVQVFIVSGCC